MASKKHITAATRVILRVILYFILSIVISINIISITPTLNHLYDFGSFIAAGKEAVAGTNPYLIGSPQVHQIESRITGQTLPSPNLNPPISVVFFQGIANADPMRAVASWRIVSSTIFAIGIFALGRHYQSFTTLLRILWAVCLAGFWITISLGQIYAPLFLLTICIWICMEKGRMNLAGILLGALIAVKPNFAVWLIALGVAGYIQIIVSAAITLVALSITPVFIFGPQIYNQWMEALRIYPALGLTIAGNSSLQSLGARFGSENIGILLSVVFAGAGFYFINHQKKLLRVNDINSIGIVCSLLISPFSWPGYTTLTLPIFLSKRRWNWTDIAGAATLIFPYLLILIFFQRSLIDSIIFGWLYGWGLLLLLASTILDHNEHQIERLQETPAGAA